MWYIILTWAVWEYIINMCVRKYVVLCASALDTFDIIERIQYRKTVLYVRMAERSKAPDSRAISFRKRSILVHVCGRGFESHFWQNGFIP